MNFLIAPDKFKHSLSAIAACKAIGEGLIELSSKNSVELLPLSDGGEGWLESFSLIEQTERVEVIVSDPLFRRIGSSFLLLDMGMTALIEMSKASGLQLLSPEEYNCAVTSSYGTGELIKAAIGRGVKKIILGIGGSATNDGGIGMLSALGFRFLDKEGKELEPVGKNLRAIEEIDVSSSLSVADIDFKVACDVTNPLTGTEGATYTYGPQKGANSNMLELLEKGMLHYSAILKKTIGKDVSSRPGAGAAGGIGAASMAFLNADLCSGIELFLQTCQAEAKVKQADIIITGEGKLDGQSLRGKVVSGIAALAKKHGKPVIALCGIVELDESELKKAGITKAIAISEGRSLEYSLKNAALLLKEKAAEAALSFCSI